MSVLPFFPPLLSRFVSIKSYSRGWVMTTAWGLGGQRDLWGGCDYGGGGMILGSSCPHGEVSLSATQ